MTISTNSNILIEGNTFDLGNSSPSGAIYYDNLILLNLDANGALFGAPGYAVINNNYLNGVVLDGYHIMVNSGSANITNNTFLGPGSQLSPVPVAAYINVSGSLMDHIITNNVFDSPTVDGIGGTNEKLVIGPGNKGALTPNTLYINNKNQTSYLPISKVPNLVDFTHFDGDVAYASPPNPLQAFYHFNSYPEGPGATAESKYGSFAAPGSMIPTFLDTNNYAVAEGTQIIWGTGTVYEARYTITVDVDEYLPLNVQILNFTIGLSADANIAPNLNSLTNGSSKSVYQMWTNTSVSKNPNIVYGPTSIGPANIIAALANTVADVHFTVNAAGSSPTSGFAVLAGSTITNTGFTVITGDLGLYPGTSVTGFPPGTVSGTQHITDAAALAGQTALSAQYSTAIALTPTITFPPIHDIGGAVLIPGVYKEPSSLGITGTVTLDAGGNPNATWTFQIGSTLITASSAVVSLINGAQAANVTWAVGSSATLGTGTNFVGSILAVASITDSGGSTVTGRLLAGSAAVTLNDTTITVPSPSVPSVDSNLTAALSVFTTGISGTSQVTPAQLSAATQYLFLDVSSLPQFYTVMPDTRITVTYQAQTTLDTTTAGVTANGYVDVYESPLIVKYRW